MIKIIVEGELERIKKKKKKPRDILRYSPTSFVEEMRKITLTPIITGDLLSKIRNGAF